MNIGDIFFAFRGEGSALMVDAQKAGEAAGTKFGTTFGAKLKAAAGGMIGAGVGAAFGVMLAGAQKLDATTRQLQADTGMTAEEAKKASHALAGMYRDNLQGFDEIGAAMAKVHNDLGLTGDAADKATRQFLKFGTATGQDAAEAVASFDDILDAWGLTAADAGTIMDKLIVSHQKFGGVISESESALAAMAPAMRAANMSVDDGIALINLFNSAGIDAASATTMLNRAIKQLKPGQDINDLIAQVGAIEDPTLRAQKAMELFGKQGALMANAIQPGMTSLDDLKDKLGDTTDATTKAADAIESGFGAQFQLLMKNAGGALADFGSNFGPLLMVASAFGPKLLTSIGAGLGGLAGLIGPRLVKALAGLLPSAVAAGTAQGAAMGGAAAVSAVATEGAGVAAGQAVVATTAAPAAAAAGTTIGGALGKAAAVAIPLAVVGGVALIADAIKPELDKLAEQIHEALFGWVPEMPDLDELPWPLGPKNTPKVDIGPFQNILGGDSVQAVANTAATNLADTFLGTVSTTITEAGPTVSAAVTAAMAGADSAVVKSSGAWHMTLAGAMAGIRVAAEDVIATFGLTLAGVIDASRRTGADGMLAMAAGITAARAKPLDAFETLKDMLKNAMTPMAEAARLRGELTSKSLAAGLRSGDPAVRAQAFAVQKLITDRLVELVVAGGPAGKKAMAALNAGIRSKVPAIHDAAVAAKNAALTQLQALRKPAAAAGASAGTGFADALVARVRALIRALQGLSGHGYAAGSWEVPYTQLAVVHAGEMIIPAQESAAIRAGMAGVTTEGVVAGPSIGGGIVINVPIQSFYGTRENIADLSRAIGQQARLATVKGAS